MLLHEVVETSARVGETAGRLDKIALLASWLRRLEPEEIGTGIAYLSGEVRQGRVGVGPAALREAAAVEPAGQPSLRLREVDDALERIAAASGKGSAGRKTGELKSLMRRAVRDEQRFLARLLLGELRQGALEGLMVEALARAAGLGAGRVRRAAMLSGDLGAVAREALTRGDAGLARFSIELFRPLQPMLAQTSDDVGGALERLGEAALEYKLDGARVQVHKAGDEVRAYSRRLREVTPAVPEIVEAVRGLPARELILDGEVIALRADGRPHPFQVTMSRFGRKLDVERRRSELPLTPFWFDVLRLDGGELIDEPHSRRYAELERLAGGAGLVPRRLTADAGEAAEFLERAIRAGHEGIMAKATGAAYEAGSRGHAWLKIKPSHTLDLVVLAAEWGHGRRKGRLSNLHLGARDTERGGFVMLGKTFKGLTDKLLEWQTRELLALEIGRDEHTVFVEPRLVVEIAFNDIQSSPRYPGGLALRFARVRRYRGDKTAEQADTFAAVRELFLRSTR